MPAALLHYVRTLFDRRPSDTAAFRKIIHRLTGQTVRTLALYEQALTHRSILRGQSQSHHASNERLEFLGDAVLGFVTAEYLYDHFDQKDEGVLTRMRAKLVNGQALARYARQIDLGPHIRMSENMIQANGRNNTSILADAFEALIGALYLDLGMAASRTFIQQIILDAANLDELVSKRDNYKSLLLEYAQAKGWPQPEYRVTAEEGPSHNKTFSVEVVLHQTPRGFGQAGSKKKAEQQAAREALSHLHNREA